MSKHRNWNVLLLLFALEYICLLHFNMQLVACLFEVTNIKYGSFEKEFADFEYAHFKSINRTYKYLSVKVKLFKVPITNVSINVDLRRKENGYKPFLYNFTVDVCKFMKQTNKNPVYNYFYGFIKDFTNMNHTCPYDHDLIVEKVDVTFSDDRVTRLLPFPKGDYAVFTKWIAYNKVRAFFNLYCTLR